MIRVNDRDEVPWREGMTVQDLLDTMGYDYALLSVTVNGDFVPKEDYEDRQIPDSAEVNVFHLAHGG
jgi:thiamine biosynthesis protein ThiS